MSNSDSLQSCPVVECVSKLNVVTQSLFIAFIYEFDFGKIEKLLVRLKCISTLIASI